MSDGTSISDFVVRAHHTAFSCADYDAAKRFFVDLLGFKVVGEMEDRSGDGLDVVVGMPVRAAAGRCWSSAAITSAVQMAHPCGRPAGRHPAERHRLHPHLHASARHRQVHRH
jgi:catechol 2,3-dioxygenase-like lactoylglutathione lyase family enzyme